MAWNPEIRNALATVLGAIAITLPSAHSIKRVYETPPKQANDTPCFIIYPPGRQVNRSAGTRQTLYTVRCRCLVLEADFHVAADIADSFAVATIAAVESDLKLSTAPVVGQLCEPAEFAPYGNNNYMQFDLILTLNVFEAMAPTP